MSLDETKNGGEAPPFESKYEYDVKDWFPHFTTHEVMESAEAEPAHGEPYWLKHYDVGRRHMILYPCEDGDEDEIVEYYVEVPRAAVPRERLAIAEAQLADATDMFRFPPWLELRWLSAGIKEEHERDALIAVTTNAFAAMGIGRAPKVVRHTYPSYTSLVEANLVALAMYIETPTIIYLRADRFPGYGTLHDYLLRQDVRHGVAFAYQVLFGWAPDTGIASGLAIEYPTLREQLDAYRASYPRAALHLSLGSREYSSREPRQIELPVDLQDAREGWWKQNGPWHLVSF